MNICRFFNKTIIYFIVFFISYELYSNEKFILPKKHLNKQYSFLSCKVDSLYYALQYYIDDLPNEEWFINQIPIKKNKYIKITKENNYQIASPFDFCIGGLNFQLARFSDLNRLLLYTPGGYKEPIYDKEGFLDNAKLELYYNKNIGFGIDIKLLLTIFNQYLKNNSILIKQFYSETGSINDMVNYFSNEIKKGNVILCNGIVGGYQRRKVIVFNIINTKNYYYWKEATHSFVLIGYDFNNKTFIAADNFGTLDKPYFPEFREISFENLYEQLIMIDKYSYDFSISIGKTR